MKNDDFFNFGSLKIKLFEIFLDFFLKTLDIWGYFFAKHFSYPDFNIQSNFVIFSMILLILAFFAGISFNEQFSWFTKFTFSLWFIGGFVQKFGYY